MRLRIKKTLRNIVLTGTALASSLGLSGVGGCDSSGNLYPSSQMAASGVAAQHVATTDSGLTLPQSQAFGALGSLLGMVSQQEAMREAAREGRSQVNVNIYSQQERTGSGLPHPSSGLTRPGASWDEIAKTRIKKGEWPLIFTCATSSGILDGKPSYKNVFYPGETIYLKAVISDHFSDGTPVANQTTYLKTGEKLKFCDRKYPLKTGMFTNVSYRDAQLLLDRFGEGEFENKWYVKLNEKWKYIYSVKFFVIDNRNYSNSSKQPSN